MISKLKQLKGGNLIRTWMTPLPAIGEVAPAKSASNPQQSGQDSHARVHWLVTTYSKGLSEQKHEIAHMH